jgi:predicted MFS family arabinose efflux permease
MFDGAFACLLALVVDDVFVDKNQAMKAIGQLFQLIAFPYTFGAPMAGKLTRYFNLPTVLWVAKILNLAGQILFYQNFIIIVRPVVNA